MYVHFHFDIDTFIYEDDVLDSFNKAFRDENNIFDHIYESKYVRNIIRMVLTIYNI